MLTLTPELLVEDVKSTIDWYHDHLDFQTKILSPENGEPSFARIGRGSAEIMLFRRQEFAQEIKSFSQAPVGGSFVLYLTVEDVKPIWQKVQDSAKVIQPLHTTDYGSTEFTITDCNGYHLMFGQLD